MSLTGITLLGLSKFSQVRFLRNKLQFSFRHNLKALRKYYPGYRMRVYHNLKKDSSEFGHLMVLECLNDILDLCNVNYNPRLGNARLDVIFIEVPLALRMICP